jgi:WD40 repeat protein
VIARLTDREARLVVTEKGASSDAHAAIEVAHEALIRRWKELRQWIEDNRASMRTRDRLAEAAKEWAVARPEDKDDYLYSGARLAVSREWAAMHRDELNPIEVAFLAASEAAERQREQDELENERRLREAAEALAEEQRLRAEAEKKQREEAQRLQLSALAGSLASQAVPLALSHRAQSDLPALLTLQAHRFNEEAQGRERDLIDRALRSVLDLPHFTEVLPNQEHVTSLALSPDARWLACGCQNGTLQVWDLKRIGPFWSALRSKEPRPRRTWPIHNASLVWLVAHPNRPIVACVAEDGAAFLIHLERADVPPLRLQGMAWINRSKSVYSPRVWIVYPPAHVVYRHDGMLLLIAAGVAFDLSDLEGCFDRGHPPPRCDVPGWPEEYFSFSSDDKVMTSYTPRRGGYNGLRVEVHRVNLGSGSPMDSGDTVCLEGWYGGQPIEGDFRFCPCTISPDGRWVVQMIPGHKGSCPSIALWDVSGPAGARHSFPAIVGRPTSSAGRTPPVVPDTGFRGFDPTGFMIFDRDSLTFSTAIHRGICLWDLRRLTAAPMLLGGWQDVTVAALSPGGRVLASVVKSPTPPIQIWPLAAADPSCAVLEGHKGAIRGLAFGPEGSDLVTCGLDDTVRVWDLKGGSSDPLTIDLTQWSAHVIPFFDEVVRDVHGPPGDGYRRLGERSRRCGAPIAIDSQGGRIAVAVVGRDGDTERERVLLFRRGPRDREPLILQPPLEDLGPSGVHSPVVLSLRFAAEGGILQVCEKLLVPDSGASESSGLGIVRSWELSGTGAEPVTRLRSWGVQPQVSLDDLGTLISALSMTGRDRYNPNPRPAGVKVWDPADPGRPPRILACAGEDFTAVAVSPGPGVRLCAAAEPSGVVWVWDLSQPDAESVARQFHFGPVLAVAFGPGDGLLAAGGDDGTVAVWALDQPEAQPIVLSGHQEAVSGLAFSPDGRLLASGSDDGTVRLWIIDLALLVGLVEERVQRNLTPTEWRRYVGPGIDYRRTCPDLPPGEDSPYSAAPFTEPLKGMKSSRPSRHDAEA